MQLRATNKNLIRTLHPQSVTALVFQLEWLNVDWM
jgi:hypothetical protein